MSENVFVLFRLGLSFGHETLP